MISPFPIRAGAALSCFFLLLGCAGERPPEDAVVRVEGAWVRAMPAGANSAVYFILRNEGGVSDLLLGGETASAGAVEIHESQIEDGIMRMREVEEVELPAGGRVELAPGGIHLMLLGVREAMEAGDSISLLLRFQLSGSQSLRIPVRSSAEG